MYISWPKYINQHILDTTSISIGNGGFLEDKTDNGKYKARRTVVHYMPEEYAVSMRFNYTKKDENGNSEYTKFLDFYNNSHKRGVNSFSFPSIRRYNRDGTKQSLLYSIISPLNISKKGDDQEISMTWREVYPGIISTPKYPTEWLDTVNMKIVDSTTLTYGDGGVQDNDSDVKIFKDRTLTEEVVPETYSVTMDFDWLTLDDNYQSEFDRFLDWYYYGSNMGTNGFKFVSLKDYKETEPYRCIYKQNETDKTYITEAEYVLGKTSSEKDKYKRIIKESRVENYKITSGLSCQKSGYCMRVTMTWQNIVTEPKEITLEENKVNKFEVSDKQLMIYCIPDIPDDLDVSKISLSGRIITGSTLEDIKLLSNEYSTYNNELTIPFENTLEKGDFYFSLKYDGKEILNTLAEV